MKVILINGSGGSGKDTVVELVTSYLKDKYCVKNISTIDVVKNIARLMGWNYEKDEKGRQFLADLKEAWTKYNNGANMGVYRDILEWNAYEEIMPKEYVMFVHVREPESIQWFLDMLSTCNIFVCTLLVKRAGIEEFFNDADKNVNEFEYDITMINQGTLEDLEFICEDLAEIIESWALDKKWFIA
jgi:hypothetical protein